MITFKCDQCGHDEYTLDVRELYIYDEVDDHEVIIECSKCGHKEYY